MRKLLLVAVVLLWSPALWAQQRSCTTTVPNPTLANVQTAIAALGQGGDGAVICLGSTMGMGTDNSVTWSGQLVLGNTANTRGIELRGAGPLNGTCLKWDDITPAEYIHGGCGSAERTTINVAYNGMLIDWSVYTSPGMYPMEVDNIHFILGTGIGTNTRVMAMRRGNVPPLMHHNDFDMRVCEGGSVVHGAYGDVAGIAFRNRFWNVGCGTIANPGNNQNLIVFSMTAPNPPILYQNPATTGNLDTTNQSLYFEQNYVGRTSLIMDFSTNARVVLRFNQFDTSYIGSHGYDSGQGSRHMEVYGNMFHCTDRLQAPNNAYVYYRGGTGYVFLNSFAAPDPALCGVGTNFGGFPVTLDIYMARQCNSTNPGGPGTPAGVIAGVMPDNYPFPRQVGWGFSGTPSQNIIQGSSTLNGTGMASPLRQTGIPGTATNVDTIDGTRQALEPLYTFANTNNNARAAIVNGSAGGNGSCRAMSYSVQSTTMSAQTVLPAATTTTGALPYANAGQIMVIAFGDNIGTGTVTPTVQVQGTNSCNPTALQPQTSGSLRLSMWWCTVTLGGPQTITFNHAMTSAARVGIVSFMHGLTSTAPVNPTPTVTTGAAATAFCRNTDATLVTFATTCPGTSLPAWQTQGPAVSPPANYIVLGYTVFASGFPSTYSPGPNDQLGWTGPSSPSTTGTGISLNGTQGASGGDISLMGSHRTGYLGTATSVTPVAVSSGAAVTAISGAVAFEGDCNLAGFTPRSGYTRANCMGDTVLLPLDNRPGQYTQADREYYDDLPARIPPQTFTGVTGTGRGDRTARPGCMPTPYTDPITGTTWNYGPGYWSDDQGTWNHSTYNSSKSGVLDICTGPNTWTNAYYTPKEFPHPSTRWANGMEMDGTPLVPQLSFMSQPSETITASTMSGFTVQVTPAAANVMVELKPSVVAVQCPLANASFSGLTGTTDAQGQVMFNNVGVQGSGLNCRFVATAMGVNGATSAPFNVISQPLIWTPAVLPNVSSGLQIPFTITHPFAMTNPSMAGGIQINITLSCPSGTGTATIPANLSALTDSTGVASFSPVVTLTSTNDAVGCTLNAVEAGTNPNSSGKSSSPFTVFGLMYFGTYGGTGDAQIGGPATGYCRRDTATGDGILQRIRGGFVRYNTQVGNSDLRAALYADNASVTPPRPGVMLGQSPVNPAVTVTNVSQVQDRSMSVIAPLQAGVAYWLCVRPSAMPITYVRGSMANITDQGFSMSGLPDFASDFPDNPSGTVTNNWYAFQAGYQPGVADTLAFDDAHQPTTTVSGSPFSPEVGLIHSNAAYTGTATLTVTCMMGSATLGPQNTATFASTHAIFTGLTVSASPSAAGCVLNAATNGLMAASAMFDVTSGAPPPPTPGLRFYTLPVNPQYNGMMVRNASGLPIRVYRDDHMTGPTITIEPRANGQPVGTPCPGVTAQGNTEIPDATGTVYFTNFVLTGTTPTTGPVTLCQLGVSSPGTTPATTSGIAVINPLTFAPGAAPPASIASGATFYPPLQVNVFTGAADQIALSVTGPCQLTGPSLAVPAGTPFTGVGITASTLPATCTMTAHNNTTQMGDISVTINVTAPTVTVVAVPSRRR